MKAGALVPRRIVRQRRSPVGRAVRAAVAVTADRVAGPRRRRRTLQLERGTYILGGISLASVAAVMLGEAARLWRRPSGDGLSHAEELARLRAEAAQANRDAVAAAAGPVVWPPALPDEVLLAAGATARQTVEVAVAGFRRGSAREAALFNLLASFTLSFGVIRASAYAIRRRGRFGPFRDLVVGQRHIHHFVPGIAIASAAGGAAIVSARRGPHDLLAIPFGIGLALTLDEAALLLILDDVYWSREGVLSIQITLSAIGLLSALILARRLLRRGEDQVLGATLTP